MEDEAIREAWEARAGRRQQLAKTVSMSDLPPGSSPAPMRKPDFAAIFERLKNKATAEERPCSVCETLTTDANDPPLCSSSRCEASLRARRWAALPKADMLRHTGVPELYREDFDVDLLGGYWQGRWPHCGHEEVPKLARGFGQAACWEPEHWACDPPFVTIIGPNQYGKTRLAVEMCCRAIKVDAGESVAHCFERSGAESTRIFPLYFIRAAQLLKEDRELRLGAPRAMMNHALAARFLILDDIGWQRYGIEALANLCEERHSRRRPTIWTSHLHFNEVRKDPRDRPAPSIRGLSDMIWARMRKGLVIALGDSR